MEKQLFLLLLNKEFYEKTRNKVLKVFFPERLGDLFETLIEAHNRYNRTISLKELKILHYLLHPSLTKTAKEVYDILFTELKATEVPNSDIATDIIKHLWIQEKAREIAEKAIDITTGKSTSFGEISSLFEQLQADAEKDDPTEKLVDPVTTDIDELLKVYALNGQWKFNIPELQSRVKGIGPGNFAIIFARPETGKTASWVSLCAAPDGFIAQGASVHALCNEEPASRTMLRCVNAFTGMSTEEIHLDVARATELFAPVKDKIKLIDSVDFTMEQLDAYCAKKKPDILVVDQLDKVHVSGSFARTDERLKEIYVSAREIAKRRNCAVLGLSQASAEGENRSIINFSMMENSKTGKAAEGDLIIGIGLKHQESGEDTFHRTLQVCKNKLTGWHGPIHCVIQPQLSRYVA